MNNDKPENLLRAELLIASVLRGGVLACLFVIGSGLALRLIGDTSSSPAIAALLKGLAPLDTRPPASLALLVAGALHFEADAVIALGLVMLIALPVIRVALTTLIFFFEKDWPFFWITLFVLAVLVTSVVLGKAL